MTTNPPAAVAPATVSRRPDSSEQIAAVEDLLARHGAAVRRLAALFERTAADRDDLVQDIWLAIWRAWGAFRGECAERTFILRIAHNRAVSHLCRRRPEHLGLETAADIADAAAGPERSVASLQEAARLLEGLRALPVVSRQAMSLSLEGLTQHDIAEILGTSESNVAVRLHRARARLREFLEASK